MAPLLFLWIASVDTRWMMQDKEKKKKMFKNGLGGGQGGFKTFWALAFDSNADLGLRQTKMLLVCYEPSQQL